MRLEFQSLQKFTNPSIYISQSTSAAKSGNDESINEPCLTHFTKAHHDLVARSPHLYNCAQSPLS